MARRRKRDLWEIQPFPYTDAAEVASSVGEGMQSLVPPVGPGGRVRQARSIESPLRGTGRGAAGAATPRGVGPVGAGSAPAPRAVAPPATPGSRPTAPPATPVGPTRPPVQVQPTSPGRDNRPITRFGR